MRSFLGRNLVWIPAAAVCCWLLFYSVAFVRMYQFKHGYVIASEWIFENVPPGSLILGVHWDDKLPLSVPGQDAHQFNFESPITELKLYELPDDLRKMSEVAAQTAQGDYIALPTARLPGSIPRIEKEMPLSTAYFQLLYSGHLGYKLVQTVKVRPSLFGVTWNDDTADESFSVYDHPKSAIFKNVEKLSANEILNRIQNPRLFEPLPDLKQMLSMNSGDTMKEAPRSRGFLDAAWWFLILELLSFAVLPWLTSLCGRLKDKGYGLSKAFGLLVFGVISWWTSALGFAKSTQGLVTIIFLILLLSGYAWGIRKKAIMQDTISHHWKYVEGLFLGTSAIFLIIRAMNPEIFWGEKPMDFTFLNFLNRNASFPPQDPWAVGHTMHYYYLGIYFFSAILKLTGVSASIGFNLAIGTLGGLIASAAYSILLSFGLSRLWSVAASLSIVFSSNYETLRLWIFEKRQVNFDLFWATSRVYTSPAFSEYTFWSLLFADLHAHVIALPFTALLLGLLMCFAISWDKRFSINGLVLRLICGVVWGALFAVNTWDYISYGLLIGIFVIFGNCPTFWKAPVGKNGKVKLIEKVFAFVVPKVVSIIWDSVLLFLGALSVILPFSAQSGSTQGVGWGLVRSNEFNNISQLFVMFGHWYFLAALGTIFFLWGLLPRVGRVNFLLLLLLSVGPLLTAGYSIQQGVTDLPWDIVGLGTGICVLGALVIASDFENSGAKRFLGALLVTAGNVLCGAELLFLIDRMNTIFKMYTALWLIFSLASWGLVAYAIARKQIAAGILVALMFIPIGVASVINSVGIVSMSRVPGRTFTLDGSAYLATSSPDEARLINWLASNISGTPTLLEAQGDSYREFTRICMNTGIPTVLGWEYHVEQRGTPSNVVWERKALIREIYSTTNVERAERLLLEFGVDLIVVGNVEKQNYPAAGLEKFEKDPWRFPLLAKFGEVKLYTTLFSALNPIRGQRTLN